MKSSKVNRICTILNNYDPMLLYQTLKQEDAYATEAYTIYLFIENNKNNIIKDYLYDRIQFIFINNYGTLLSPSLCMNMAQDIIDC